MHDGCSRPVVIGEGKGRVVTCMECPDTEGHGAQSLRRFCGKCRGRKPDEAKEEGAGQGTATLPLVMGILKTRWEREGGWIDGYSEKKEIEKKWIKSMAIAERTGSVPIGIDNPG